MSVGVYEESLVCGGTLKVTISSWEIRYYFPGPDLRYSGTFMSVPGAQVKQYMAAFTDNWLEYLQLKKTIPEGGEFSKTGKMGMSVRVGGSYCGVCLRSYHMPINSEDHLKKIIDSYLYAEQRAPTIQKFLISL